MQAKTANSQTVATDQNDSNDNEHLTSPGKGKRGRETGRACARTLSAPAGKARVTVEEESGFNRQTRGLLTSSRWVGSTPHEKNILTTMLSLKDKNGIV
jgi:hypothetical protein